jgi:membrane protein
MDRTPTNRSRPYVVTDVSKAARPWSDVVKRVYGRITEARVLLVAAGVTFYALLAIFPAIVALISIYGLFADPSSIASQSGVASGFLPDGALDILREQMERIAQARGTLGFAFLIGLLISLWSANGGMKALFDALNVVYGEKENRSFIWLNIMSLSFTVAAIAFLIVTLALVAVVPLLLNYLGLENATQWLFTVARWPLLLLAVAVALALIYRYGPSRAEPKWRWITWGSACAAIGWIVLSLLFSWYAANFASYNRTYGSLGAVIAFMTWMWLSATVVLVGAAIDVEMERQAVPDTGNRLPNRGPMGRSARARS